MNEVVKSLSYEILRRFPELKPRFFDAERDSPHPLFDDLIEWLRQVAKPTVPLEIGARVIDFDRWCMSQPPGQSAADDIPSICAVSLREELFRYDELLPLLPRLISREELLTDPKYFTSWVGADRYEAALRVARREWKGQRKK